MIKDERVVRQELEKANPFWLTGSVPERDAYPQEREEVQEIVKELSLQKISILTGPRRVGKSVLLKHAIAQLLEKGTPPQNILYYSLDDPYLRLYCDNLIRDLSDYWLEHIATEGEKFVFFDEIHFVEEWHSWLKVLYDRHKEIKIVVSGSSSLAVRQQANTYLRGRYVVHELLPLTFRQFLALQGQQRGDFPQTALAADVLVRKHAKAFAEYLLVGGFPEWLEIQNRQKWFLILKNAVSNKAVYEDIAATFRIRNVKILEQVLAFMVANQSRILSYEAINEVAGLKHEILTQYISYLISSYLILEILKHGKTIKEQLKAKRKYLCIDQGLRNALLREYAITEDNEGFVVENVVGIHCAAQAKKGDKQLHYYRRNGEIDFIINDKETVAIEVKYKTQAAGTKKTEHVAEELKPDRMYIVTKNDFGQRGNCTMVPALIFCLFIDKFV